MTPTSAPMPDYRWTKKPVTVEAFKCSVDPLPDWFMDRVTSNDIILHTYQDDCWCEIKTLEELMCANKGDWIIKGVKGEIYPCKPDIFEATYTRPQSEASAEALDGLREADRLLNELGSIVKDSWAHEKIAEAIDALATPVPVGWKLVPIEPTDEMQDAIWLASKLQNANSQYRAMVAAAPPHTEERG